MSPMQKRAVSNPLRAFKCKKHTCGHGSYTFLKSGCFCFKSCNEKVSKKGLKKEKPKMDYLLFTVNTAQ